jgi:acyl-lipid omega-6 desaturase (Delta-12 desaturase)
MTSMLGLKQRLPDLIRRHATPNDARALAESLATLIPMAVLWWAAILSLEISRWLTAAVVLLLTLFSIRGFVLMHECGHGSLFRSRRLNFSFGFIFGVLCGMPQYVWSKHHAFHHAHNGNWEKYRGPLTTASTDEYAAMSEKQRRIYRYTRHIAVAPAGGFVYLLLNPRVNWIKGSVAFVAHVARRKLAAPGVPLREHAASFRTPCWTTAAEYRHMAWNNVVFLSACVLMSAAVGVVPFLSIYVASVSLAGAVGLVLFTVQHNFEHSYAANTARWDYDAGAMRGTSFLVLPRWLNWFTASIGYHHVHHLSACIPFYRLATCHRENDELFADVTRLTLRQVPGALRCILWDTRAERIISIAEHRARDESAASCVRAASFAAAAPTPAPAGRMDGSVI